MRECDIELELTDWLAEYTNNLYRLLYKNRDVFKNRDILSIFRDFMKFEVILRNKLPISQSDFEYIPEDE